jgi:hypothetical protein
MFVVRHLFPEIRDEVPENFSRGLIFWPATTKATLSQVVTFGLASGCHREDLCYEF